jgi:hypothetical protein
LDIPELQVGSVKFPGIAGALQEQGSTASLVRELGDNYDHYHAFLAGELAKLERPEPKNFSSYDAYAAAWTKIEDIVHAEIALRGCKGFRRFGKSLNATNEAPLIDKNDRLVADPR